MDNFEGMESKRKHKYSKQIKKDVSDILQKDSVKYYKDSLVTITDVDVTVDLSLARIYFSIFPNKNASQVMQTLNDRKSEIRGKLGRMIGKQVRIVPELAFFHDDTEERASHMDRLIDNLHIPPAEDSEEDK